MVEVGGFLDAAAPGGPAEQSAIAGMQHSRRIEFLSGRYYARQALLGLGAEPCDIAVASDRGPAWPAGIIGSITHTGDMAGGWVVAAVGRVQSIHSLGIDMELLDDVHVVALDGVLRARERTRIMGAPEALRARDAGLIWCAKEAAIKAARGVTEPIEIEIALSETGEAFKATWHPAAPGLQDIAWNFNGRCAYRDGYLLAAAFR